MPHENILKEPMEDPAPQDIFTDKELIDWAKQRDPLDIFTLPELKAAIREAKEYAL